MSKSKAVRRKSPARPAKGRRQRKRVMAVGLILMLSLTGLLLAQWRSLRTTFVSPAPVLAPQRSPSPPQLSKEYIYAGGKLVATEEPALPYNASITSQQVNAVMTAGQSYSAVITVQNTGTMDWTTDGSIKLYSTAAAPALPPTSPVSLASSVSPTQQTTLTLPITAPTTPGRYNFRWQMKHNGTDFFGAQTANVSVLVRTNAPDDFDGDGKADIVVFRPSEGNWYVLRSSDNTVLLQYLMTASDDKLVPGDYDGDKQTDIAVWNPTSHNWTIKQSSTGTTKIHADWGNGALGDIAVPADYDGDGKTDMAVFRPSEGNWYILNSSTNTMTMRNWGAAGDKLVPADYDGDGKTDLAVWRPSEGNWYILNSGDGTTTIRNWGGSGDKLVPADYDGDGKTDLAIWRESEGNWYILRSSDNTTIVRGWGEEGDIPVPTTYVRP